MYAEGLMQAHAYSVVTASVSASPYKTCLGDSVDCALLMPLTPLASTVFHLCVLQHSTSSTWYMAMDLCIYSYRLLEIAFKMMIWIGTIFSYNYFGSLDYSG